MGLKGQKIEKEWCELHSKMIVNTRQDEARTYLQLPLRQWGASNVYLLVLSSRKLNIGENPISLMGL